jgi:hypothetical protein
MSMRSCQLLQVAVIAGDDQNRRIRIDCCEDGFDKILDHREDLPGQVDPAGMADEVGDLVLVESKVMLTSQRHEYGGSFPWRVNGQGLHGEEFHIELRFQLVGHGRGQRLALANVLPGPQAHASLAGGVHEDVLIDLRQGEKLGKAILLGALKPDGLAAKEQPVLDRAAIQARKQILDERSAEKSQVSRENRVGQARVFETPEEIRAGDHVLEKALVQSQAAHEPMLFNRALSRENRRVGDGALDGPALLATDHVCFHERPRQGSIRDRQQRFAAIGREQESALRIDGFRPLVTKRIDADTVQGEKNYLLNS